MSTEEPPLQANGTDTEKTESAQRTLEVMVDPVQDEPTLGPVLAWNSVASFLAEVEPVTAAGVAGVLVIFVLVIFGRIGALVVGFLGGALLHASIDKRKEEAHWKERFTTELTKPEVSKPREEILDNIPPKTNLALRYFWDLLIRDYVDWWFAPLSNDNEFPSACRHSLEYIAASFSSHVQSKTPADMVMLAIMSASSTLIVFFRELRTASLETESTTGVAEYLRNNPDSALAQMVDEKFQHEKLRHLATRLLANFAKKGDLECEAGRLFAREMLAMQVLNLTATSCSTSSYINWYIVETFKEVEEMNPLLNDSRAKEAEEAMARAVAEAAEMTRLLEAERGANALERLEGGDIPQPNFSEPPKTTFASILQDNYHQPAQPPQIVGEHPSQSPPRPAQVSPLEPKSLGETPASTRPSYDYDSPSRLSSSSIPQEEDHQQETLRGATITVMDLSTDSGAGKSIRQKTTLSYMITIEPAGGRVPGWVAIKQFADFESLHDVLKRLAYVGGLRAFPADLPEWKGKMHQPLAEELEAYLKIALSMKQLADSEAMKRFFGKEITEQSLGKKKAWTPLKGVGNVKEAVMSSAEGSQKLLAAAWATAGINKKRTTLPPSKSREDVTLKEGIRDGLPTPDEDTSYHSPLFRESATFSSDKTDGPGPLVRDSTSESLNGYTYLGTSELSRSTSISSVASEASEVEEISLQEEKTPRPPQPEIFPDVPKRSATEPVIKKSPSQTPPPLPARPKNPVLRSTKPELSENDAQQILDIGFSILSEFYALSPRTWMIRKSLLNLLKSLLISNGRTYVETIRSMIQEDLIKKCLTSDEWLASQVRTMTEALWPTVPWPPIDDEAYKRQAKELFLTKMVPETMRGLMGGAATTQALEIVFEALQDQRVAKGIMIALMCDIIRALQV